jgi:ribosomal protein RSM22 (predicted rRNA methylase)
LVTASDTHLRAAIEAELQGVRLRALHDASEALSARYRDEAPAAASGRPMRDLERLAYLTVRMPATRAAIGYVLDETRRRIPDVDVRSLLDLGAGTGAALWAAADTWPSLAAATLVDADEALLDLGRRVWRQHPRAAEVRVDTRPARLERRDPATGAEPRLPLADLVTMSYVVGELDQASATSLVERAWSATRTALVLVEPGTPRGYRTVLAARTQLLALGAALAAPCPHAGVCPLIGDDWCHFAVRLARSRAHRLLKSAELAWEDEKLSYLVAVRQGGRPAGGRILRRPDIDKGRIGLRLCAPAGLVDATITRRDGDAWRAARHAKWGDAWSRDEP